MARLTFLGAARTVTGSQYLLEAGGRRLLVDSGMFQGEKELRLRNWAEPEFPPAVVDAVVLTHTHLDHIGRVPRLVKQGFRGAVYCTPPTKDLAEILLLDAAHLQKEDAGYLNRKGLTKHAPALPLFDEGDVREALALFRAVPVGRPQEVSRAFSFAYRDAGHLLRAASADVLVREDGRETRVLFSGDKQGSVVNSRIFFLYSSWFVLLGQGRLEGQAELRAAASAKIACFFIVPPMTL